MTRKRRCRLTVCACACHLPTVRQRQHLWTPSQDRALLDALRRGRHIREVAADLGLTLQSVTFRVKQLDQSLCLGWRSRQGVARALGVSRRRVTGWWRSGLLVVAPHGTRWTRVTDAELERFVSAHGGRLFAPEGVRVPQLRRLAEVAAMANGRAS